MLENNYGANQTIGQSISVINYKNPTIKIQQELASPFHSVGMGPFDSSQNSSTTHGGQMLRKSYDEESEFQNKLNFAKHKS